MSDSSDTSAIDDKKTTNEPDFSSVGNFFKNILILILLIVVYFAFGGLALYSCKLAQTNILPTNKKCYPYSDTKPNIQPIKTNIFTTFTDPPLSMKLNFPYDEYNSSNTVLDIFRKYKEEPHSNFLANYFISIFESLIHANYSFINTFLNLLNGLPELVVILFGPMIIPFAFTLMFLFDHLYVIYLWFVKMSWFFKENTNTDINNKANWQNVSWLLEPFKFWCGVFIVILFCFLFWFLLANLPVIPFITMTWCIFSATGYKGDINGKDANALTIIKYLFKYYKSSIMTILSFFIVVSAFANLGAIAGIFSLITLILIYFGIFSIGLFKESNELGLSELVSNKQARKTCDIKLSSKPKHGLLYHLIFGQEGGSITKELKNIGKKLT